jgi:hypothetical protein
MSIDPLRSRFSATSRASHPYGSKPGLFNTPGQALYHNLVVGHQSHWRDNRSAYHAGGIRTRSWSSGMDRPAHEPAQPERRDVPRRQRPSCFATASVVLTTATTRCSTKANGTACQTGGSPRTGTTTPTARWSGSGGATSSSSRTLFTKSRCDSTAIRLNPIQPSQWRPR